MLKKLHLGAKGRVLMSALNKKLTVRDIPKIKGRGLFATERIEKGETIWAPGDNPPKLTLEGVKRLQAENKNPELYSQIDEDLFAYNDPESWCLNHSCDPNCGLKDRVVIALRTIEAGEEVHYDYSLVEVTIPWRFPCKCGGKHCRRMVTYSDILDAKLIQRSGDAVPPYAMERTKKYTKANRRNHLIKRKLLLLRYWFGIDSYT